MELPFNFEMHPGPFTAHVFTSMGNVRTSIHDADGDHVEEFDGYPGSYVSQINEEWEQWREINRDLDTQTITGGVK